MCVAAHPAAVPVIGGAAVLDFGCRLPLFVIPAFQDAGTRDWQTWHSLYYDCGGRMTVTFFLTHTRNTEHSLTATKPELDHSHLFENYARLGVLAYSVLQKRHF